MEIVQPDRRAAGSVSADGRDRFLDAIRTIALVRVMLWHAFGAAFLTYVVAAVPTMFFVTGSLLAKSLDRRPWPSVLTARARRMLVPLWAFAAVAFATMRGAWLVDPSSRTAIHWRSVVFWIVPLGDPKGSAWEGGWLSQPLWYVRAMFWLLLLSPLLRRALRRFGAWAFVVPLIAVFALDAVARHPAWTIGGAPDLLWQIGDLALYSIFLMAGFAHRDGRFDHLTPRSWFRGSCLAGVAATAWIATQPVPLYVVNNSHPAHLFVGATWLCMFFACRAPITRFANRSAPGILIGWVSRRSMTIYLWHSTAIILTYQVLARGDHYPPGGHAVLMIVGMVSLTTLLVLLFGWIEDVAARRSAEIVPLAMTVGATATEHWRYRKHRRNTYRFLAAPAALGTLIVATTLWISGPATAGTGANALAPAAARRLPVPSQAPPRPQFQQLARSEVTSVPIAPHSTVVNAAARSAQPSPLAPDANAALAEALQGAIDDWRTRWNVPGVVVGAARPGIAQWYGASGADEVNGLAVHFDDAFDITSVTKTFTGTIVLQLASEGKIDLDAPLPTLTRVPNFPYDQRITVRMLLEHRSGLTPYRDTPTFRDNPDAIDTPLKALDASLHEPLQFVPGVQSAYSTTNYLVLGFLIEQVAGKPFDTVLRQRVLDPLALRNIVHRAPGPQEPNFATSGIVTDTATLLRWAVSLYRDGAVTKPDALAAMHSFDPETGLGAASFGYCPCTIDELGVRHWRWIGHSGGTTQFVYSDVDDIAIALNVTDSLWLPQRGQATAELIELIRATMLGVNPSASALPGP